jgi:ribonuclease E
LETVLAMARGAQTPVEERLDAPEALARRGVAGATMSEIAAVVRAGERAVPSPRRPYDTQATYDSDGSDDDFVGPAGGAGLPLSSFVDEAQLDAAVAAAAEHGRRAALAAASPLDPAGAASASAARLSAMARSLEADTSELSGSRSLNLSEDTTHLFSNTMDDVTAASLTEADAAPSTAPAPSTLPGSSSSGDAEAEMRASLAATAAAMDRVTQEAEAAEAVLAAAARRAAVRPASAFDETAEYESDLPGRVEVPALKPLDAILGALGEQVRALDAAAAEASARAPESQFGSSSSGGSAGDANVANASATQDDSALYAAAAAAANDSAPPSSYDARSLGEVSAHRENSPSTPGDPNLFASPAGAPAETPQSADAPPYGLKPQRDAFGGYGANAVDVAAVAARIAAAAVADAAPGETPDATARRVASAMEAALGGAFKKAVLYISRRRTRRFRLFVARAVKGRVSRDGSGRLRERGLVLGAGPGRARGRVGGEPQPVARPRPGRLVGDARDAERVAVAVRGRRVARRRRRLRGGGGGGGGGGARGDRDRERYGFHRRAAARGRAGRRLFKRLAVRAVRG